LLLDSGANVNKGRGVIGSALAAIYHVYNLPSSRLLLERGAIINERVLQVLELESLKPSGSLK